MKKQKRKISAKKWVFKNINKKISYCIKAMNIPQIKRMQNENKCKHLWTEFGFGYECDNCGYYTGMNGDLNKLIEKQNGKKHGNKRYC